MYRFKIARDERVYNILYTADPFYVECCRLYIGSNGYGFSKCLLIKYL